MIKLTPILIGFGRLWLNKSLSRLIRVTLVIISLQIILIIFFFPLLPPQVPLYYSRPWGDNQLASPSSLFLLPAISFFFLLLNSCLIALLDEKKRFLALSLAWNSLISASLALIGLGKIISIII